MGQQEQILNVRPKILSDVGIWTEESDPTNPFSVVCCEHGLISLGAWDFTTPSNFLTHVPPNHPYLSIYPHLSHSLCCLTFLSNMLLHDLHQFPSNCCWIQPSSIPSTFTLVDMIISFVHKSKHVGVLFSSPSVLPSLASNETDWPINQSKIDNQSIT